MLHKLELQSDKSYEIKTISNTLSNNKISLNFSFIAPLPDDKLICSAWEDKDSQQCLVVLQSNTGVIVEIIKAEDKKNINSMTIFQYCNLIYSIPGQIIIRDMLRNDCKEELTIGKFLEDQLPGYVSHLLFHPKKNQLISIHSDFKNQKSILAAWDIDKQLFLRSFDLTKHLYFNLEGDFINPNELIMAAKMHSNSKDIQFYKIDLSKGAISEVFRREEISHIWQISAFDQHRLAWIEASYGYSIYRLVQRNSTTVSLCETLHQVTAKKQNASQDNMSRTIGICSFLFLPAGYAVGLTDGTILLYSDENQLLKTHQFDLDAPLNKYDPYKLSYDPESGNLIIVGISQVATIHTNYKKNYHTAISVLKTYVVTDLVDNVMDYLGYIGLFKFKTPNRIPSSQPLQSVSKRMGA
jgi:hypothetical protein